MLAIGTMSAEAQAIFFGFAVICFALCALGVTFRLGLQCLGLALFAFPFFWNQLAQA